MVRALTIEQIQKRDGSLAKFDVSKITGAIMKAMDAVGEGNEEEAKFVAQKVYSGLRKTAKRVKGFVPTVEGIQDIVETELFVEGHQKAARHYVIYREDRAKRRKAEGEVPEHVRKLSAESKEYFRNGLAEFVYYRSYSKWIEKESRRETWIETVNRYIEYMRGKLGDMLTEEEYAEIRIYILEMGVMPSMRLMWSSGQACEASNVTAFNCAFIAPTCFQDLGEILYILCCGTGVGYSVEAENIEQFPIVQLQKKKSEVKTHVIEDSKEGWANALVTGLRTWFEGRDIKFDPSNIRPAGARLKTMGGRASGPDPLMRLLNYAREIIFKRQGRRLTRLDWHDIICMIGDVVVSGGVRRSALICLSDLDDVEMRDAKKGHFFLTHDHRRMANNSTVYRRKPTDSEFLNEWKALVESGSGERGIFNRGSLPKQMPTRRTKLWEEVGAIVDGNVMVQAGTNPCGEITLLSKQFCNLTEIICRVDDTLETLRAKMKQAVLLGTYQSMLTDYPYLSKEWKENCERERLLGVSITGQWDCPAVRDPEVLKMLYDDAIKWNKHYAKRFGINISLSITCVKPSGTVSQLVDSASGMHPRHAKYYIRRVRISATEPLFQMLKDQGLPYNPEVGQVMDTATTFVFDFPVKAPEKTKVFKDTLSAREQLEHWKMVKTCYTEHNPSITISVGENEWYDTGHWVMQNWDIVGGLSFLPREEHVYQLAPYEEIDEKKYKEMLKRFENVDYSKIMTYEKEDQTQGSRELACAGGVCEIQ